MQELRKTMRKVAAIGASVAMLGMTITGALAADMTLADYPKPFQNGGDTVVVYGAASTGDDTAAATDIVSGLPAASSSSSSSTETVSTNAGTIELDQKYSKDITVGTALNDATAFGGEVRDTTLAGLKSGTALVTIGSNTATPDYHERINFTNTAFVATGLTLGVGSLNSSSERYGKNVLLRFGQNSFNYYYFFDGNLAEGTFLNNATTTNPIQLDFLGKTLSVEAGGSTNNKVTALAGDKFSLEAGDSVVFEGKKVTVDSIGSSAVRLTVDGVSDTFANLGSAGTSTKTVAGLSIRAQDLVDVGASTTAGRSSVVLVISEAVDTSAVKTYTSGDHFIGQNKNNPLWVWDISGTHLANPKLGVTLGQSLTSTSISIPDYQLSHPPYVGDLLCLPNNYACITIEKVSEDDDGFGEYQISPVTTTLYNVTGGTSNYYFSDAHAIMIKSLSTTSGTGLKAGTAATDTSEIYVYLNGTAANGGQVQLFKKDTTLAKPIWYNTTTLAGTAGDGIDVIVGSINYKSTSLPIALRAANTTVELATFDGTNTQASNYMQTGFANNSGYFQAKLIFNQSTSSREQFQLFLRGPTTGTVTNVDHLGHRPNGGTYQSNDLLYVPSTGNVVDVTAYSSDVRAGSGVILSTPKTGIENDDLRLYVPKDTTNYKATVTLATTKGGAKATVVKGTVASSSSIMMKDTEVTDVTLYNAIVVGGPAVNKVAADLLGLTFPAYGASSGLTENEAVVELKKNGSKYALIVAGWEAADTRRAGVVLKNYASFASELKGSSVSVKGTGMEVSGITVEAPAAQ